MGLNIKIARIKKGLTQKQLAEIVGLSRDYIANLENEKSVNPTLKTMKSLSKALNVSIVDLFFSDEK